MKSRIIVTFLFIIFACAGRLTAANYVQYPGVAYVHSTVSSGLYSMEEMVKLAKEMGLKVLVMTDQDLVANEYGVSPFRNLIKKRGKEIPSRRVQGGGGGKRGNGSNGGIS